MLDTATLRPAGPVDDAERMVAELEQMPVGPQLAAALIEVRDGQPGGFGNAYLQARLAACWSAVASWFDAQALDAMGAGAAIADADDESPYASMSFTTDLALATRQGEGWVAGQIDLAKALISRLPVTRFLVDAGQLSVRHAGALARALDAVTDDELARTVDAGVAERAVERGWTPAELAAAARRLLLRIDPDGGADRHETALDREAGVTAAASSDGVGWLHATGDVVTVGDILDAVDERARRLQQIAPDTPVGRVRFAALGDLVLGQHFTLFDHVMGTDTASDDRAAPEVRADEHTEPARNACGDGASPAPRPQRSRRHELIVTLDLPTLLGLRDNPAEIAGYGPVPARIARLLLDDATLRRMITDPVTGQVLDVDRRCRVAGDTLAKAVRARDRHCRFPGCRRALRIEVDHRTAWADGGPTASDNLQLLCSRHHALKTAGLWSAQCRPDGTVVWTGTHGQTVIRHPDHHPPDDTG